MLIGISGRKGSGKSLIAEHLRNMFGTQEVAFADAVKRVCMALYPAVPAEVLWGASCAREKVIPQYGVTTRKLLQLIGDIHREKDASAWVAPLMHIIDQMLCGYAYSPFVGLLGTYEAHHVAKGVVVTDVRYPNEMEALKSRGALLIRVERDACLEDSHSSENSLHAGPMFDVVIDNNGTIPELLDKVSSVIRARCP